jgi:hypothetical protein
VRKILDYWTATLELLFERGYLSGCAGANGDLLVEFAGLIGWSFTLMEEGNVGSGGLVAIRPAGVGGTDRGNAHGEHASKTPGAYVEMTRRDDGFFVHIHTCEMSPILYPNNRDILITYLLTYLLSLTHISDVLDSPCTHKHGRSGSTPITDA